jgi:hypothetical protein
MLNMHTGTSKHDTVLRLTKFPLCSAYHKLEEVKYGEGRNRISECVSRSECRALEHVHIAVPSSFLIIQGKRFFLS